MTNYKVLWEQAVEHNDWIMAQNARLKGNKRENPTLRDQFAMAALTALITIGKQDDYAECAYTIADNMMKARDGDK